MSYNGIGLQTPRGSGTNGHISKSLSSIRKREPYSTSNVASIPQLEDRRRADLAILQHEAKRQIENRVLLYRIQLEESEPHLSEEQIEEKLAEHRRTIESGMRDNLQTDSGRAQHKSYQTHDIALSKDKEMDNFRSALGVRGDYEEGTAMRRRGDPMPVNQTADPYDPLKDNQQNPLDRRRRRPRATYSPKRKDSLRHSRQYEREDRRSERERRSPGRWKHDRNEFRSTSHRYRRSRSRSSSRSDSRSRSRSVHRRSRNRSRSFSRDRYSPNNTRAPREDRRHSRSPRRRRRIHRRRRSSSTGQSRAAPAEQDRRSRKASPKSAGDSPLPENTTPREAETSITLEAPREPPMAVFDRRKALGID